MGNFIKRTFIMLSVCLFSCIALTSCGDDPETEETEETTSIVGTWRGDHEYGYVIYDFKKDGSYTRIDEDFEYGSWSELGIYEVRGDKYITTTTDEGEVETMTILLFTNTTLTLCWEKDDILTFSRQR